MQPRSWVILLLCSSAGCGAREARLHNRPLLASAAHFSAPGRSLRVVLVTLDGVRRNEVFGGVDAALAERMGVPPDERVSAHDLMPNLHERVMAPGVALGAPGSGASFEASGPNYVSLPGYREILTGRRGSGCAENVCLPLDEPTLLDDLHSAGWSDDDLAVIASWETVERATSRDAASVTVTAGRHGGASRDRFRVSAWASALLDGAATADPFPGRFDYRPDRYTAELALEVLKRKNPRFMMVALGDPDEYAHRKDYRGYLQSLTVADAFLGRLLDALETQGGETLLLVTTDHGREHNLARHGRWHPESRYVWLAARGARLSGTRIRSARYLRDIAPTLRAWLGLADDHSPRAGAPIGELALSAFGDTQGLMMLSASSAEPSWR
jgi:hypothetical protein